MCRERTSSRVPDARVEPDSRLSYEREPQREKEASIRSEKGRERERETNSRARPHRREINFGRVELRLARYRKTTNATMFKKSFLFLSDRLA